MADCISMLKLDPAGITPSGSTCWDEKGHGNIVQILIWHNKSEIKSIQFQYAENGKLLLSTRHSPNDDYKAKAYKFDAVRLDYPSEYLTSVSGSLEPSMREVVTIKFGTNKGEYGPFGHLPNTPRSSDTDFCFRFGEPCQFGGFYGTIGSTRLTSIGVYLNLNAAANNNIKMIPKEEK